MDKHAHISSLIGKLRDDNLSSQELRELQHLFRSAEAKGEVKMWLDDLWESSVQQTSQNVRIYRLLRSFMRYAAVFLLAVAFSWYWFSTPEQPTTQRSDTNPFMGMNEVSVTYGSKTRIVLPDSSVVFLNSGSRLSYPYVFDGERHVTLTGEGYFVVRSDSLHPFLVHTADVSIKALGTEFNIKAYPEEGSVETVLVNGSVEILKKGHTKSIIELKPGEKAAFIKPKASSQPKDNTTNMNAVQVEKEQPQMMVYTDPKPDVSIGWVKDQLVFDAEPFEQIAARIERWFNVEIDIRNESLSKARLSGRYDTENIEQVMHSLQMTTSFTYKIEKNKIIIK